MVCITLSYLECDMSYINMNLVAENNMSFYVKKRDTSKVEEAL